MEDASTSALLSDGRDASTAALLSEGRDASTSPRDEGGAERSPPAAQRAPGLLGGGRPQPRRRAWRVRVASSAVALLVLVVVPTCLYAVARRTEMYVVLLTGGIFLVATLLAVTIEVKEHVAVWSAPKMQRHVVRILLMSPVYALASFVALLAPWMHVVLATVREIYESIVIWSFTFLVIQYVDSLAASMLCTTAELLASKAQVPHVWPFSRVLAPWPMGEPLLRSIEFGVVQYVCVRPITALCGLFAYPFGLYRHGDLRPNTLFLWTTIINSISQGYAIYSLVMLYRSVRLELDAKGVRPLSKFILIKGIVFATFWQGIIVAICIHFGVIQRTIVLDADDSDALLATRVTNFLVLSEMPVFAVCQAYAFSSAEFAVADSPRSTTWQRMRSAFFDASDLRDAVTGESTHRPSRTVPPVVPLPTTPGVASRKG